jgi:hypothetical protein
MDADLQDLLAELAAEAEPEPKVEKKDGEDWGGMYFSPSFAFALPNL